MRIVWVLMLAALLGGCYGYYSPGYYDSGHRHGYYGHGGHHNHQGHGHRHHRWR